MRAVIVRGILPSKDAHELVVAQVSSAQLLPRRQTTTSGSTDQLG